MPAIRRLLYRLLRLDHWHESNDRGFFEWRRYSVALDRWDYKMMSPDEQQDAVWNWSIK